MEAKLDHAPVVVNPFVIYIAVGLSALLLQKVIPLPFLPETPARLLGLGVMIANMAIGLPAVRKMLIARTSLNPAHPTTALVESGPYRFTRNPMYIGLTLLYTGLVIFFQLPWGLVLVPAVIWLITNLVIKPEEKYLEARFGKQYMEYKDRVRRWL